MDQETINKLIKRIDLQVSLTISPIPDNASDQDKISRLANFGLTPAEIASVLGSTSEKISKQLYAIRNKKLKK